MTASTTILHSFLVFPSHQSVPNREAVGAAAVHHWDLEGQSEIMEEGQGRSWHAFTLCLRRNWTGVDGAEDVCWTAVMSALQGIAVEF